MRRAHPDTAGVRVVTGFHAVEETLRAARNGRAGGNAPPSGMRVVFSKEGPRVKRILALAAKEGIPCDKASADELDALTAPLPPGLRDHRGLVLVLDGSAAGNAAGGVTLDALILSMTGTDGGGSSVVSGNAGGDAVSGARVAVILDRVTDPHNVGAVLRSADQFGASAVIVPERRSAKLAAPDVPPDGDSDAAEGVVARSSAGASAWVPLVRTANLARAVEKLKQAGFWIYGAEAGGGTVAETALPDKTVFVMGSEGCGISRLLREKCDAFVSIPTAGRLDSLNVSVAAGILLYEFRRQKGFPSGLAR